MLTNARKNIIQPKLTISQSNDKYEQEADAVADQVMRMPQNNALQMQPLEEEEEMLQPKSNSQNIQRQEEEEEELMPKRKSSSSNLIQRQPMEEEEEMMQPKLQSSLMPLQRQPMEEEEEMMQPKLQSASTLLQRQPLEEEEEMLQPKSNGPSSNYASQNIHSTIKSTKGKGSRMDHNTSQLMNKGIGADFSRVNVHTGSTAIQLNQQLNARAFTVGNDIYFNSGNYNPASASGKRLLAHELTHVVQQGSSIQRQLIQRDPPTSTGGNSSTTTPATNTSTTSGNSGGNNQFARLVAGLLRDQLSNTSLQGHLRSLGTALQGLAVGSNASASLSPERLAALNISGAFETTSRAIINDRGFRNLRQRIVGIIGGSDEAALIAVLAAAIAVVLADIPVRASNLSQNLGGGVSVGGGFDFGSIQSLQFNNLNAYAQYASTYFQARIGGSVSRDADSEEFSGSGTGRLRLGNNLSNLLGSVTINSDGEVTLVGRLQSGYSFGGNNQLVFSTNLQHTFASGETIITPGVSGRFNLGRDQSLRLGSQLQISTDNGLTGATGFIEYQRSGIRLRIEGNMTGIPDARGIAPGGNMQIQGVLTIPF